MTYAVKEILYTLQGEGANAGRPAVFCRFSGCNLWSGRESDRATALCRFCDTDFVGTNGVGGGRFDKAVDLAHAILERWPTDTPVAARFVVLTGGEPLLQVDRPLLDELHSHGFRVAVETNGTVPVPEGIDWVCVSPKAGTTLAVHQGDELKLVFPQAGAEPSRFVSLSFDRFYLQPMDGPSRAANTTETVRYCLEHPTWRLSLQAHKVLGIQ